jgi:YfiH family protein
MAIRSTFTSRLGGLSTGPFAQRNLGDHVGDDAHAVAANRRALAAELRVDRVIFMRQVHGNDVAVVERDTPSDVPNADALVTDEPGIAVAVLVADCVPVVIAGTRAAAVAHAGRRGVQHDIVTATVAALRDLDAGPLRAWLGPAICGACYEVPGEMQAEVAGVVPATRSTTRQGTAGLDLRRGVAAQLQAAGVNAVQVSDVCTAEDPSYFSYRRDGVTGRFAGVAIIDR